MGYALLLMRAIILISLLNMHVVLHASNHHMNPISLVYLQSPERLRYDFIIDEEGGAIVRVRFHANRANGSSWIFVPRFSEWLNYTVKGRVYRWTLGEPEKYADSQYYFYKVLDFQFVSDEGEFELIIEYNFSLAAMVVETESMHGIFYSPQIGFKEGSEIEAAVIFPSKFKADLNEALAIGRSLYKPDKTLSNSSFVLFRDMPTTENLLRIQVGFRVFDKEPDLIILDSGVFRFNTVKRYEPYARKILNLYNLTYSTLTNLFNATLREHSPPDDKSVTVRFFVPDFNSLMSIGGYVPFSGGELGDIYVNIIFARYVEGYLEVIALHELIHHFLWKAGISPQHLLWFHEGVAQYASIEIAEGLSYEGAKMIKNDIEKGVEHLISIYGNNLGFLADWTPSNAPRDLSILYTAAYYVISRLAAEYGGLNYYSKFFKTLSGRTVRDNVALCYYLSAAANESVAEKLNAFGFNIPDLYRYWPLVSEFERAMDNIDPNNIFLKPFWDLANLIYRVGVSGEKIFVEARYLILLAALLTAYFAPLVALLTYSSLIFAVLIILLKARGVFKQ
ncbi:MAG: hypothetical protein N3E47_07380 [Candidatus Bathyarchaeota archaeon]|nr:hypothetical protein [Candidatus Bathyarchaeota archaeon]